MTNPLSIFRFFALLVALGAAVARVNACSSCSGSPDGIPYSMYGVPNFADVPPSVTTASAPANKPAEPAVVAPSDVGGEKTPLPEIKRGKDGYWQVSFAHLASFPYHAPAPDKPPSPGAVRKIPEEIRALDGKRVTVAGYMLPTKLKNGLVKEFLLLRTSMMCCYGVVPPPNEWIVVKMTGPGVAAMMDVPLNLSGALRVGEIYQDKAFVGLYALEGEKIGPQQPLAHK